MKNLLTIMSIMLFSLLPACSSMLATKGETNNEKLNQTSFDMLIKKHMKKMLDEQRHNIDLASLTISDDRIASHKQTNNTVCAPLPHSGIIQNAKHVSIDYLDADLREALIELSMIIQIPIVIDDTIEGMVTVSLSNAPLSAVLDIMLGSNNYSYRAMDGYILIGSSLPNGPVFSQLAFTCRYKPLNNSAASLALSLTPYFQQFIRVAEDTNFLTITAPRDTLYIIRNNLQVLDQSPGQILLEMNIVEVSRSALDLLGVSWNQHGVNPNTNRLRPLGIGEWNGLKSQKTKDIIGAFTIGQLPTRTLAEALQIMEKTNKATIKAMPSIVSIDGKNAHFTSTKTIWLNNMSITNTQSKSQKLTYGVDMHITPHIANNNEIILEIKNASVSDISQQEMGMPVMSSHIISSTVKVKHGEYLILGGLLQTKKTNKHHGIPRVKNIPLLGRFFGQEKNIIEEKEVLIMIRPRILQRS